MSLSLSRCLSIATWTVLSLAVWVTIGMLNDSANAEEHGSAAPHHFTTELPAAAVATPRVGAGIERYASVLSQRTVFGPHDPAPPALRPEAPDAPSGALPDHGAPTDLPVQLVGTSVTFEVEHAMAILRIEGRQQLARVGSDLLDGRARVVAIAPRRVLLKEERRFSVVELWTQPATAKDAGAVRGRSPAHQPVHAAQRPRRRGQARPPASRGVRLTKSGDYQVERTLLRKLAQNPRGAGARYVRPKLRDGRFAGLEVGGVQRGGVASKAGLRSGDVVESVNGRRLKSPADAVRLYDAIDGASSVKIGVRRGGRLVTLSYALR